MFYVEKVKKKLILTSENLVKVINGNFIEKITKKIAI